MLELPSEIKPIWQAWKSVSIKTEDGWAGEMIQRLRERAVPEVLSSKQQPHDGSHPSIMRSGAQNTIYIINKLKKKKNEDGRTLQERVNQLHQLNAEWSAPVLLKCNYNQLQLTMFSLEYTVSQQSAALPEDGPRFCSSSL